MHCRSFWETVSQFILRHARAKREGSQAQCKTDSKSTTDHSAANTVCGTKVCAFKNCFNTDLTIHGGSGKVLLQILRAYCIPYLLFQLHFSVASDYFYKSCMNPLSCQMNKTHTNIDHCIAKRLQECNFSTAFHEKEENMFPTS